jgi:hypothetical protein
MIEAEEVVAQAQGRSSTRLFHEGELVAEVVEAEIIARAIGDVGEVGGPLFVLALLARDVADGEPEFRGEGGGEFKIPLREVGVHGGDVDAPARQGEKAGGHGGDERFAFPGRDFGDGGLGEADDGLDLAGKGLESARTEGRLAHAGESLGEDVAEAEALAGDFEAPSAPALPQFRVGERAGLLLPRECPREGPGGMSAEKKGVHRSR